MALIAATTHAVYERNAIRFDRERSKSLFERAWIDRFLSRIPTSGHVLDVGCGSGRPIADYIIQQGVRLTGVDFSKAMLEIATARHPAGDWRVADMRTLHLPERFDGIIAWDSFFHLTPAEQRSTLPRIAKHLKSGGVFLTTAGPTEGEGIGRVGDDPVYHSSLSPDGYSEVCSSCGLTLIDFQAEDPTCDYHSVVLAKRTT